MSKIFRRESINIPLIHIGLTKNQYDFIWYSLFDARFSGEALIILVPCFRLDY